VLLVTAFRILWRFRDGPPPYPPAVARWEGQPGAPGLLAFFLTLLWMPITGFLTSYYGGHPIKLFNLIPTPALLPKDKARAEFFDSLHLFGQWAVYGLILLHLSTVAFHLIWLKDGVLGRRLPSHATEPAPTPTGTPAALPD
jgi:cytochrome b561